MGSDVASRRVPTTTSIAAASVALAASMFLVAVVDDDRAAMAYRPDDYAGDAVANAVIMLRESSSSGDAANGNDVGRAFDEINSIIREGKGVGGTINFQGVNLERGYVANEDTTIYNPGLTLLTESEKERLVEASVLARNGLISRDAWTSENQISFEYIREKLDPYHTYELSGYLRNAPLYVGIAYLLAIGTQLFLRGIFPVAYFVLVFLTILPALVYIALGPT